MGEFMNKMSIDPSKRSLGIYITSGNNIISHTIKAGGKEDEPIIYARINSHLKEIIEQYHISLIFLEDYAFSTFGKSRASSSLAEIAGIIKMLAFSTNCQIIKISISTWKSFFHGLPVKKNKAYTEFVNKRYNKGEVFKNPDECDAFMIMQACHYIYRGVCKTDSQVKLRNQMLKIGGVF
jgi:Holliday junction resolvasome RuvABC endonuclease subunit